MNDMRVYAIYDPRKSSREFEISLAHWREQGIDVVPFEGTITKSTTIENINSSHKAVILLAKSSHFPDVCILEEDCLFPAEDGWQYFLRNKPSIFDIYLGGVYSNNMENFRQLRPVLADSIIPITRISGFHCYIVHENYYDKFLSVPDDAHIDDAQRGGIYKVCYPFAAIQRPGWSATNRKEVDYNVNLLPTDVYGWE
jgi:hypothetical protein